MSVSSLQRYRFADGAMLYDAARIQDPQPSLFDAHGKAPVSSGGRQAAWYVCGGFGDAVLRHYRRGGLVARLSRDRYVWGGEERTRAFAELRLLEALHLRGLAVPRPLAAAYWRSGLFYRAAILIERIPDVLTLAQSVELSVDHEAVARALHAMHDAGAWHADLNANNILLDRQGRVWLIDFDRGRLHDGPLPERLRVANLQRLRRSLVKLAQERGEACWQRIHGAYCNYCAEN